MRKFLVSVAFLATFSAFAQTENEGWTYGGNETFLLNQAALSKSWTGGGTGNISANFLLNYDFNYKKGDWNWDNKVIFDYGMTKQQGDKFVRKTNDRLEFNSILGRRANKEWFYSALFNFKTQTTPGYDYNDDTRDKTTYFMSPGYFQLGLGMLWKKNDNLKVNISPAAARLIVVSKDKTVNGAFFGVQKGDVARFELGASLSGYAKFNVMENVSLENLLNLYSDYLDKPLNVDIDYTLNVVMTINKYLSANFTLQAIYDDNAVQAIQWREAFGLGVNYKF